MSKFEKKLLGIATVWPFAYMILFVLFFVSMIFTMPNNPPGEDAFIVLFPLLLVVHFLTIFLIFGLNIFYIVNVFRNDRVLENTKVLWVVVLFFAGLFAMPVYWYLYIWPADEDEGNRPARLNSAAGFEFANRAEWEQRNKEPVPPEPHSWR